MQLKYLPLLICLGLPSSLVITFGLAVHYKHVTYFLPYISDSGAFPPESCIFSQSMNMVSVLMGLCCYIRFRQVKEIYNKHDFPNKNHDFNKITYYIGLIASVGVSLVGNFQETAMLIVHWAAAVMAFGLGSVYFVLQSVISYNIYPIFGKRTINSCRIILSIISTTTFIAFFITGLMANHQFNGTELTKWSYGDGGFQLHVISSVNEWICASCVVISLMLYSWDFEEMCLNEPEIFVQDNFTVPVNTCSTTRNSSTDVI